MIVGSILENREFEKRIAVTPDIVKKYKSIGLNVCLPYKSETLIIKNINLKMLKKSKLFKEIMV